MKNGDCLKGILEKVDNFMNLKIKDIIYTPEGSKISMKIKESYVRGNNINSMQFREGLIEKIEEEKELTATNLPQIINTNRNLVTVNPMRGRGGYSDRGSTRGFGRGRGGPSRGGPSRGGQTFRGRGHHGRGK